MTEPDDYTEATDMAEEKWWARARYCAECGSLTNHTTAQHLAAPRQSEP